MPDFSNAFGSAFNANAVTGQANASQAASANWAYRIISRRSWGGA